MQLQTLNDLFEQQLQDLYATELELVRALSEIAAAASHPDLRQAFDQHLRETQDHLSRLEEILAQLGIPAAPVTGEAVAAMVRDVRQLIQAGGEPLVRDAALIAAAQRIEHYEIAGYGTARTLADELGFDSARDLLDQTVDEEGQADKLLTKIATGGMFKTGINQRAPR